MTEPGGPAAPVILSIQSAVAYGHVGNSAAMFPLQLLGAEVWPIDTVQFSNHPGYGSHAGNVTSPETIRTLVDGIAARGVLPKCDALLTGYVGDPGTGGAILHAAALLRRANPAALWCCDPVIGDEGPGIYVKPGIASFFRDQAVELADLLTPNQFELGCLSGQPCDTTEGLRDAIAGLRARMRPEGPRIVLVTSVRTEATPGDALDVVVADAGGLWRVRTPLLPIAAHGAGDVLAAVFLLHILRGATAGQAMAAACSAVHGVLTRTCQARARELRIVAAQDEFRNPTQSFKEAKFAPAAK